DLPCITGAISNACPARSAESRVEQRPRGGDRGEVAICSERQRRTATAGLFRPAAVPASQRRPVGFFEVRLSDSANQPDGRSRRVEWTHLLLQMEPQRAVM